MLPLLSSFREYKNKRSSDDPNAHTSFSHNILRPSTWNSPTLGLFKSIALVAERNAINIQALGGSEAMEMLGNFLQRFGRTSCANGDDAHHMLSSSAIARFAGDNELKLGCWVRNPAQQLALVDPHSGV